MPEQLDLGVTVDERSALFSPCRRYRYALWRVWSRGPGRLVVIGLNPSTADETKDDPTVRRCVGFARRDGYDGLVMLNLFGYRATDPAEMLAAEDPVGPDNDRLIRVFTRSRHDHAVAAWGVHGAHRNRATAVMSMVPRLRCWGATKDGYPRHPLYLPADAPLEPLCPSCGSDDDGCYCRLGDAEPIDD